MSNTTTTKKTPAQARTSVYRTRPDFLAALGQAQGLVSGAPAYKAAVRVLVHLSWRGPKSAVAWHKGTNADVVANAKDMGADAGTPLPDAMAAVLAAADKAADTKERKAAVAALRKALA